MVRDVIAKAHVLRILRVRDLTRLVAVARGTDQRGQGLVEFALIAPILLLLVVAIADFGRLYNSMVAVEAAGREAADYGSFKSVNWDPSVGNPPTTTSEMLRRACTATAGSHLEDYSEPAGTIDHATCTNPSFTCTIISSDGSPDSACATYTDTLCSDSTTDPPCTVRVKLTYTFRPFFSFNLFDWTPVNFTFDRVSTFRISDLPVAP
jgi:Flp pilus assembly protein TadG